jgi:hypothetical protein
MGSFQQAGSHAVNQGSMMTTFFTSDDERKRQQARHARGAKDDQKVREEADTTQRQALEQYATDLLPSLHQAYVDGEDGFMFSADSTELGKKYPGASVYASWGIPQVVIEILKETHGVPLRGWHVSWNAARIIFR